MRLRDGGGTGGRKNDKLINYKVFQECRDDFENVVKIAENVNESVLNYEAVCDGDKKCVFVLTGDNVNMEAEGMSEKHYMPVSVWASYDGEMEKLKEIELENYGMALDWGVELYQFGKKQHYFVSVVRNVKLSGSRQYKFCFEDGHAREIDNNNVFWNDNG